VTATEEERLLADTTAAWPRRQGLIVIHSRCAEIHDWLSAACRSRGFSTVWQRPPNLVHIEGAAAALFDGSDLSGEEADQLRRLTTVLRSAPVIALFNFPRVEDCNHAMAAGATVVLSKPLAVDDLFWELERTVGG
jgi:DNA-binding NarL/FixJ family response regulator